MKQRRTKRERVKKGGMAGPSESHSHSQDSGSADQSGESWTVFSEQFQGEVGLLYWEPIEFPPELLEPIELPPELLEPMDLEEALVELGEIHLEDFDLRGLDGGDVLDSSGPKK